VPELELTTSNTPSATSVYFGTPASKFVPLSSTSKGQTIGVYYSVQFPGGVVSSIETPEDKFTTPEGATVRVVEIPKRTGLKDVFADARQPPTSAELYAARSQAIFGVFDVPVFKEVFSGLDTASEFLYARGEQVATQQEKAYPGVVGQLTGATVKYPVQFASGFIQFPKWAVQTTGETLNIAGTALGAGTFYKASQVAGVFSPELSVALKRQSSIWQNRPRKE
jgi:hypothetical protein